MKAKVRNSFLIKVFRKFIVKLGIRRFSMKCDISPSAISRWEKGTRTPSNTNIKKICNTFNLPSNAFELNNNMFFAFLESYLSNDLELKDMDKINILYTLSQSQTDKKTKKDILKMALYYAEKEFNQNHLLTLKIKTGLVMLEEPGSEKIEKLNRLLEAYKVKGVNRFVAKILYNLAHTYLYLKDYRNSNKYINNILNIITVNNDFSLYLDTLQLKATIKSLQKKYNEAENIFIEILNLHRKELNDISTANLLNNMSIFYFRKKDYDKILEIIKEANNILKSYSESDPYILNLKQNLTYTLLKYYEKKYTYNKSNDNLKAIKSTQKKLKAIVKLTGDKKFLVS